MSEENNTNNPPPPEDAGTPPTPPILPTDGGTPPPPSGATPPPPPSGGKGAPYTGPAPTKDDMTMGMLCHLLAIITGFVGPLIIWLIKKDTSPFVDDQGKEALNFWITETIIMFVGSLLAILCVPLLLALIAWILGLIFAIQGAIKANKGIAYRYPVNFRMIK